MRHQITIASLRSRSNSSPRPTQCPLSSMSVSSHLTRVGYRIAHGDCGEIEICSAQKTIPTTALILAASVLISLADRITRKRQAAAKTTNLGSSEKLISESAANAALKTLDGQDVSLSQYKGNIILVNFWATWCVPCRAEIPWLIEMEQIYGTRGFVILGVAVDDDGEEVVRKFVGERRFEVAGKSIAINYRILIGNDKVADRVGGLFGIPTSILISRDGTQIKRVTGMIHPEEFNKILESQL